MTPKFEAGEVVVLQSMDHPEMNGEYTVEKFIVQGKRYHDILSNCTVLRTGPSGYSLIGGYAGDVTTTGRPCVTVWCESALRKKHQPGEMSFRDLMQTLKDPSHA